MAKHSAGSTQEQAAVPPAVSRPHGLSFGAYVLVIALTYIGDLFAGVWLLFTGLQLPTETQSLSSLVFWFAAWVLCYLAYGRSKVIGFVLVGFTVVLTVPIIAAVFHLALLLAPGA